MNRKQLRLLSRLALVGAPVAAGLITTTSLHAQAVSAGLTGIVADSSGKPVAGAVVTAVHTPTNGTYKATTNASGRYSFTGLPVGGPFNLSASADGATSQTTSDVYTELGQSSAVDLKLGSDVLTLEKFVVLDDRIALDPSASGGTTVITADKIEAKSSTQRSFADLFSTAPQITLRSLSGDREEAQITAAGQNNRYNSVMIDGNRINDQFGLNATGLASFFNPLSFQALEQVSVKLAPYDVTYSGFTGAALNAVTKSGTNKFSGSAYYIFAGDHLAGLQMQGPDAATLVTAGRKSVPKLERTTKGLTFGGPLWKDHVFFFLNWEKFERTGAPSTSGLLGIDATQKAQIDARIAAISKVNYGSLASNASTKADEEKKLLKIDWNISQNHRLSLRYSTTEGEVPQFGSYTTTSFGSNLNSTIVGGATTAYSSHFYAQTRTEESYSAQLFSQWTSDLKTELKWSRTTQDQDTPVASVAPEVRIFGVTGINQSNATVTNGVVVLGAERFRHGNAIAVDTDNYSAITTYSLNNVTFTAGFDREENDYYNLFRQFSYGVFDYASVADFVSDNVRAFQRNYTDLALKGSYADISDYAQTGVFGQAKWDVTPKLNLVGGIRYDWSESSTRPAFNQQFLTDTGMRNDGTVDGATDVSPRLGFNWMIDDDRTYQLRGGAGYFVGRAPWVFWSNSYGQTAIGTYTSTTIPTGGLTGYLANDFNASAPMGTGTQTGSSRAEVDLADDKTHMPSLWRYNLGFDTKLRPLDATLTLEIIHSVNDNTLFIQNDNLKVAGTAADGRTYFAGNPSTASFAKYANYTQIYHLKNVEAGQSTYATIAIERPMKNKWAWSAAYTKGEATEAQASGQTTASGMFQRNVVFNQGKIEVGTSDFEIKDRVQLSISRQFKFFRDWKTTTSLFYEGHSGAPYSFAYSNDLNLDGVSGNDTIAVPNGAADARFDFSSLSSSQLNSMLAFIQANDLAKYAGSYAPKNAFYEPWVNRLDFKIKQNIPLQFKTAELELFLDFTNLGTFIDDKLFNYVERSPSSSNDVFSRRLVGNASIDTATGKIKVTSWSPGSFTIDNTMSRWRMQVGATLKF